MGGNGKRDHPQELPVLRAGTVLAGKFVVQRPLGKGAMGRVYVASQEPMGREVALKLMQGRLASNPVAVQRFLHEAVAISKLKHPNTVTLFDFGRSDDGDLYLAMELVEGRTLRSILAEEGKLSLQRTVRIVSQVALSLAEAHRKGVIHRDLKPSNILIADVEGQPDFVKVIDFGIAQLGEADRKKRLTGEGATCGTPEYMSPEQLIEGRDIDRRSDLFTLGAITYEMLEGRRPFAAESTVAAIERKRSGAPDPMSDNLPQSIRAFVLRLLSRDPNGRPDTAEEMLAELQVALPPGIRLHLIALPGEGEEQVTTRVDLRALDDPEEYVDTVVDVAALPVDLITLDDIEASVRDTDAASAAAVEAPDETPAADPPRTRVPALALAILVAGAVVAAVLFASGDREQEAAPDETPAATASNETEASAPEAAPATQVREEPAQRPLGSPCDSGDQCRSGSCSNGHCAPEGFAYIPAGRFAMGSLDRREDARHEVTITRPFFLRQLEVTQREWNGAMDRLNTENPNCGLDCPAENNRWSQAALFLNALSARDGLEPCYVVRHDEVEWPRGLDCQGYRFPTEAEWEYAARAGSTTDYPCGDRPPEGEPSCLLDTAWIRDNSDRSLHPVGEKPPNAFGLYDIIGNAWEWTWDAYEAFGLEPQTDPTGPPSGSYRVRRGCSYASTESACESSSRNTYGRAGIRPARSVPTAGETARKSQ